MQAHPVPVIHQRVRTIDPELLVQELRSGRRILIVDVRATDEFRGASGRIQGSWSLPLHHLRARAIELGGHRSEALVVVSRRGNAARTAAVELELLGFTEVSVLDGGMQRWVELGLPVIHPSFPPKGAAV
jgi:rhodanese-related sulfurtransferase